MDCLREYAHYTPIEMSPYNEKEGGRTKQQRRVR